MTKYEIKTRFEGYINNIKSDDEYIYNLTRTILDIIDEVFGEYYNNKFIEDLSKAIEKANYNDSEFSFTDVENRLHNDIDDENVQKFEDIQFSVPYINSALNENIKTVNIHFIYTTAIVVINNLKQVKNTILLKTQIFQNNYIMIHITYIVLKTVL